MLVRSARRVRVTAAPISPLTTALTRVKGRVTAGSSLLTTTASTPAGLGRAYAAASETPVSHVDGRANYSTSSSSSSARRVRPGTTCSGGSGARSDGSHHRPEQQPPHLARVTEGRRSFVSSSSASQAETPEVHQSASSTEAPPRPSESSSPTSLESTDILDVYKSLVARGLMRWDAEQARCVLELRKLLQTLEDYRPPVELLRRLSPDAPMLARRAREKGWLASTTKGKGGEGDGGNNGASGWWDGLKSLMATGGNNGGGDAGADRGSPGWRERALVRVLSGEEELAALDTPKGILLTGPPGTGKSHLMQLFFSLLPTTHKARHHYHPFLLSLYQAVWRRTQARMADVTPHERDNAMDRVAQDGWRAIFAGGAYAAEGGREEGEVRRVAKTGEEEKEGIAFGIARDMILQYHVLYFDELQLVDASSASLLRDILSWYWRLGGVIVATSNRLPEDLYHHGVQRERMRSFLEALRTRCEVFELDGGRDYRLEEQQPVDDEGVTANGADGAAPTPATSALPRRTWFGPDQRAEFEAAVAAITGDQKGGPSSVSVYGRRVRVPWAVDRVARFTFADLCDEPLGTADYITLASRFETFIIDDVPYLELKHKNQARRLINLVDALYESNCKLIIASEATPEDLFFPDAAIVEAAEDNDSIMAQESVSEALNAPARPNVSRYTETSESTNQESSVIADETSSLGDASRIFRRRSKPAHPSEETTASFKSLGIFTGEDERFAYKRAVSRLIEMSRSRAYARREWQPLDASHRRWEEIALSKPPPPPAYMREALAAAKATTAGASNNASPPPATNGLTSNNPESLPSDFADEAGYSRNGSNRNEPPKIAETHVWGMREDWGPKAGEWGKGAAARRKKD